MLLYEFAIEPEAISNWSDFRFVVGQCGVHYGRLISRFPGKWEQKVIQACKENGCTDVQIKKISYRLNSLKRQFIRNNRDTDNNKSWLENARQQHKINPFHAVIMAQPNRHTLPQEFIGVADIDGTTDLWNVPHGVCLPRRAAKMAKCVSPLFQISRKILLVDPHFNPNASRFINPLKAFIKEIQRVNPNISKLEYHLCKSNRDVSREDLQESCNRFLPQNFEVHFVLWPEKKFHARYVLTDVGGIDFNHGLDIGRNDTDASLLESRVYEQRWREFQLEEYQNEPDKPYESIVVSLKAKH